MQLFIIRIIHYLIVLFMLFGWIIDDPMVLMLYIVSSISLKVHWYLSDDTCALTLLEQAITKVDKYESFMHKIVNPIYKIEDDNLSSISKQFTSVFLVVAIYKFYKIDGIKKIKDEFKKVGLFN